jgi:thymidylate synthase
VPLLLEVDDLRGGYVTICQAVRDLGVKTAPRGQKTREVLEGIIILRNPVDALPIGVGRKLNTRIALIEAAQLVGGVSNVLKTVEIQPRFRDFLEPNGMQHGAYGPRVALQLGHVVRKLQADPDTRQAVVTLWDPVRDNWEGKRDYPCTTMLQFFIRNYELVLHTTMRSNDVFWGLAHDAFQFTQLQLSVARALGVQVGPYHHHAVSLHMYERDLEAINRLHWPTPTYPSETFVPLYFGFGARGQTWDEIQDRARAIALGEELEDPTDTEMRYIDALA